MAVVLRLTQQLHAHCTCCIVREAQCCTYKQPTSSTRLMDRLSWLSLCVAQPMVYMAVHMALVTLTFLMARLFWESFWAHTVFLIFILAVSAFNGAS